MNSFFGGNGFGGGFGNGLMGQPSSQLLPFGGGFPGLGGLGMGMGMGLGMGMNPFGGFPNMVCNIHVTRLNICNK